MTPEQQAEAAKRREAEMAAPRPIAAFDSVWTEELTWMEVRDAIKAGKTTGLILTGGVESNGPHLATGKHNFILKVMGEAIARKLGNVLVAPIVTLEPGEHQQLQHAVAERLRAHADVDLRPIDRRDDQRAGDDAHLGQQAGVQAAGIDE